MTISDASIRNPVFAWMLMLALMLFGWLGFSRMGVSLMPDVDFPVVTVSLTWEGAAPEIMETEVVDLVEDALTTVEGVREISSSSRQGQASVTVEFDLDRDIDIAMQEVQNKLAQAQRRLPVDLEPPVVSKTNPEDRPIMWIGLSGDRDLKELMLYARDSLKHRFQTVPGVGEVFLGGFVDRNLRIWLDAERMAARQITVQDVLDAISRQHREVPAGQIETPTTEFNVRTLGEFASPERFGELLITHRGGQPIHVPIPLKEVARVEDGLADLRRISRVNGERAVSFGIRKQSGANTVAVARGIRRLVEEASAQLPKGMKLGVNYDSSTFVEEAVHELNFHILLAAGLTSLVCWVFLGSWSSTLNVLLAIPTSILGTFIFAHWLGFTLNTFTLLGLTLAIGIVVDDAIMVLENIVRHAESGKPRREAAADGAREITFAAMAATVAILAIFVPVIFMEGVMGLFLFQYGVTISIAVALSLLEALTLTPMRCARFLNTGDRLSPLARAMDAGFRRLERLYERALAACLRARWAVAAAALALFGASVWGVQRLPREFVPHQDQSVFMVRVQTPVGSSMEFTDEKFREIEAWLKEQPALKRYLAAVGGFGGGEVNTGVLFLTMHPPKERPPGKDGPMTQKEFMARVRSHINSLGDVRGFVLDLSQRGLTASRGFPIEFTVRGPDWETLTRLSEDLIARMEASKLLTDIDTDYKTGMPEVLVLPDRAKAYARGVSVEAIGTVINAMVGGLRAGYFTDAGRRYEIRVRAQERYRLRPEDVGRFYVRNAHGELVRLSDVVRIVERKSLLSITRKDRERAIGIFANVAPGRSQGEAIDAVQRAAKEVLPENYRIVWTGSTQSFQESFRSLLFALLLGVVVAYMVLGAQFNSFVHPFTVLLALPFSVTGALLALWVGGMSLNLYSMIGLILLMGIVKKNSILLVDFTNQRRAAGLSPDEALREACPLRLRPILMTSLSTVAAALPSAFALGPGSETRAPMAAAIIGGVAVSTFLTLLVVPCAYSLLARFDRIGSD